MDPGPSHLPTPPLTFARVDRTGSRLTTLHGDRTRHASRLVVHAMSCPFVPTRTGRTAGRRVPRRRTDASRLGQIRSRSRLLPRQGQGSTSSLTQKLDSTLTSLGLYSSFHEKLHYN